MCAAVASQFNSGHVEIRRVPFVTDQESIVDVVEEASLGNAMIASTLVLPALREAIRAACELHGIIAVDDGAHDGCLHPLTAARSSSGTGLNPPAR